MQPPLSKLFAMVTLATLAATLAIPSPVAAKLRHRIRRPLVALRAPSAEVQRVSRLTRLALLVRREAMLRDFLLASRTETSVLRDDRSVRLDGIEVSHTTIGLDFLGAPILHARVCNLRAAPQALELIAVVAGANGARVTAATILTLGPGEIRMVELLAPRIAQPSIVRWSSVAF